MLAKVRTTCGKASRTGKSSDRKGLITRLSHRSVGIGNGSDLLWASEEFHGCFHKDSATEYDCENIIHSTFAHPVHLDPRII
jgi:hypothetical protein